MSATALWDEVKLRYDEQTIVSLTNVRNRAAGTTTDAIGIQAAQDVIDSFPIYIQAVYDPASTTHVQVGIQGVICFLWLRGGSAAKAQAMKLEEWEKFGEKLKNTEPRGHASPETNATSTAPPPDGYYPSIPWAHPMQFRGLLPRRRGYYGPYGGPEEWQ